VVDIAEVVDTVVDKPLALQSIIKLQFNSLPITAVDCLWNWKPPTLLIITLIYAIYTVLVAILRATFIGQLQS